MIGVQSLILLCASVSVLLVESNAQRCTPDFQIVDTIMRDYDVRLPGNDWPVQNELQIWVQNMDIDKDNQATMRSLLFFHTHFEWFVTQKTLDKRLSFEGLQPCTDMPINLAYDYDHKIWNTNLNTVNTNEAKIVSSPEPNIYIAVYPNGTVWRNYRMTLKPRCTPIVPSFPTLKMECTVWLESYSFNASRLQLQWAPQNPVLILKPIEGGRWTLESHSSDMVVQTYPAGQWYEAQVTFVFARCSSCWLWRASVMPGCLCVLVTFLAMFLANRHITARAVVTGLCFVTVVLLTNYQHHQLTDMGVSLTHDLWMAGFLAFIVAALVEMVVHAPAADSMNRHSMTSEGANLLPSADKLDKLKGVRSCARGIFRILYAIFFAVFLVAMLIFF